MVLLFFSIKSFCICKIELFPNEWILTFYEKSWRSKAWEACNFPEISLMTDGVSSSSFHTCLDML